MEGTIATIMIFAGNFSPLNWMYCNGQLLSIEEYTALFSLIGTTYGGDGQTTFALPDMRSRIPVGMGTGPGLGTVALGQAAGAESVTLTQAQMPAHQHFMTAKLSVSTGNADGSNNPANALATTAQNQFASIASASGTFLGGASISMAPTGGNQPVGILQPYLSLNYVICVEGIYPSRS